jgi:hypothetical protein
MNSEIPYKDFVIPTDVKSPTKTFVIPTGTSEASAVEKPAFVGAF